MFEEFKTKLSKIKEGIVFSAFYEINEICIYHENKILWANWTTKNIKEQLFSPNLKELAIFKDDWFFVNWNLIW